MDEEALKDMGEALSSAVHSAFKAMPSWSEIRHDILVEIRENYFHKRQYRKWYKKFLKEIEIEEEYAEEN